MNLPSPAPQLQWRDDDAFVRATLAHLRAADALGSEERLQRALFPAVPYSALRPLLPSHDEWVPAIGLALAQVFEQAIVTSLP